MSSLAGKERRGTQVHLFDLRRPQGVPYAGPKGQLAKDP
jgi:hypothetical protein